MAARIIEAAPDKLAVLEGRELVQSIRAAGGRSISAEVVAFRPSLIDGVCNAAVVASFGADIVHLNHYDVDKPLIAGLPSTREGVKSWAEAGLYVTPKGLIEEPFRRFLSEMGMGVTIGRLRNLIGRVAGISLEPSNGASIAPPGRLATPDTAARAVEQGAAYITIVSTPTIRTDVLYANIAGIRERLGQEVVLVAGRMPWGGAGGESSSFLSTAEVEKLVSAGVDVVLLPAPGTCEGATIKTISSLVAAAHDLGILSEVTVGSSQESGDPGTVRRLALDCKMTGADILQIGDGGYGGMTVPENVLSFATAIKGRRHTYRRMAL